MAGFIPPSTLEQIRAASDILDIIGAAVPLKRSGANFMALCPFHREKTPSFYVNPRKQTFHCFGCHKGGDVFTFLRDYEGLDFVEAVKRLAERARIPLEFENNPEFQKTKFIKDKLLDVHEQITARWHHCLLNDAAGEPARAYLQERGVSPEAIKLFRLGYSPEPWDDILNWAKSKSYDPALLEQGGLVIKKEGGSHYFTRFRHRLMFPICDEQGRVIGFSARVLPGSDDNRKYINSPETPLFHKSRVMFGLDKSKRALLDKQYAIVCEGQLDLIACFMAGLQNIVAPQGTAFTSDHARILKRYVNEVVLCFDSDKAGQDATVRVLDGLLGSCLAIRVAAVPAPHDPDSYIKNFGPPAFQDLIDKAAGFFDHYLNQLCATNDLAADKGQQTVIRSMAQAIAKTRDQVLFDKYAQRTAARLGINPLSALTVFKRALASAPPPSPIRREPAPPRPAAPPPQRSEPPASGASDYLPDESENFEAAPPVPEGAPAEDDPNDTSWRPHSQELWLLKLLLAHDEPLDWARAHLDPSWISNPLVRTIAAHRLSWDDEGHPVEPAAILNLIEDPRAQSLITESLAEDRPLPDPAPPHPHHRRPPAAPSESLLREQMHLRAMKKAPLPEADSLTP